MNNLDFDRFVSENFYIIILEFRELKMRFHKVFNMQDHNDDKLIKRSVFSKNFFMHISIIITHALFFCR